MRKKKKPEKLQANRIDEKIVDVNPDIALNIQIQSQCNCLNNIV